MKDRKLLVKVYSGDASTAFWKRINALPDVLRWPLYSHACTLQDAEGRVLRGLEEAERAAEARRVVKTKKRKTARRA